MTYRNTLIVFGTLMMILFCREAGAQEALLKSVVSSGGGTTTGQNFSAIVTIGQPLAGIITGADNSAHIGFWYKPEETTTNVTIFESSNTEGYRLAQNNPNPFRSKTEIHFEIPKWTHVTIVLYDQLGNKISTLVDESLQAGKHQVELRKTLLVEGVYYYEMLTETFRSVRKCIVLR